MRTMLFVMNFERLYGAYLKVFDYFNHVIASHEIEPLIYLTPESAVDDTNPFVQAGVQPVSCPIHADIFFTSGLDWRILDGHKVNYQCKPVINLVQSIKHSSPEDPRYQYLTRPALRCCVSHEVERAILASGRANGPIVTIENGLDMEPLINLRGSAKRFDVFIGALKNEKLGVCLADRLQQHGLRVDAAIHYLPRAEYLSRIAQSQMVALLPDREEGFYLPALEAMAVGTAVIVPDCLGNRAYCRDGVNCLVPSYDLEGLLAAVTALKNSPARIDELVDAGFRSSAQRSLAGERKTFLNVLKVYLESENWQCPQHC